MTTPEIIDSRLKLGTLTIDGVAYATQMTNVRLEPSTDADGDALETLSGATIEPDDKTTWQLVIVAIQDFDDVAGFIAMTLANAGDTVPVVWQPNATGVSYAVSAKVRPVPIGGDVAARLTTSATWPCDGAPVPTYPS